MAKFLPRWPGILTLLAISGIYLVLSSQVALGPNWLILVLVVTTTLGGLVARHTGSMTMMRSVFFIELALVTLAVLASAVLLVNQLLGGKIAAITLLVDAALVWLANVLTFAVWYWEIDAGGPHQRHHGKYESQDFIFPQMSNDAADAQQPWTPGFVDYLFLAFNTSTAFSPTDTLVLSQRAKVLFMLQSLISFVVVVVLAARAINALPNP